MIVDMESVVPAAFDVATPRFRTLPPADVAYRSAQMQALVAEAFAAKAAAEPPRPVTCCTACTFPIGIRERFAMTKDGIYHAGCRS